LDSQTYVVVDDLRRNAERRELELKGKSAPVEAFAIRAKSQCSASG
jgi:hypothetical protein